MPVPPAELTAQLTIEGPDAAKEAGRAAAAPSGVAREAGAESCSPAAGRVLAALGDAVAAALEAGAHGIDVRLETPPETR